MFTDLAYSRDYIHIHVCTRSSSGRVEKAGDAQAIQARTRVHCISNDTVLLLIINFRQCYSIESSCAYAYMYVSASRPCFFGKLEWKHNE